jgi:hypothetical protein
MRNLISALAFAFSTLVVGQVPFGYLVVAESGTASTDAGLRFVDPDTGVATDVRSAPGAPRVALPRAVTVTIDATNPVSIPFVSGVASSIAPAFQRAAVQGNQLSAVTTHTFTGASGLPTRIELTPTGILATIYGGTRPGLWLLPSGGGTATLLAPLPGAYDVAVNATLAYVNTYRAATPTQIEVVDLNTGLPTTLGTMYPPLRALAFMPGAGLLAGDDTGMLHVIDPTTGAIRTSRQVSIAAIIALAGDGGRMFALTSAGEVFDAFSGGTALYVSTQRANDIAFGTVDLASFLIFGNGCGSAVVPPHQGATGVPSVGNAGFAVAAIGGVPNAPAVFVFGRSRTSYLGAPLPLPLDFLQMPRCALYTDVVVILGLALDAAGNATLPLAIPNVRGLRGTHFTTQWFAMDLAANPLGLAATDGGEAIVR